MYLRSLSIAPLVSLFLFSAFVVAEADDGQQSFLFSFRTLLLSYPRF